MCLRASCSWNSCPGNSTNPASYPFPVKLVEVKGANTDTVILHPSQKLLEDMIQLAKELEKEDVRAITTSCGFNAIFQEALANAVDIPVFTSSLLQVPFAQALVGRDRAVGVITASASSLSEKHLAGLRHHRGDAPHRHGSGERPGVEQDLRPPRRQLRMTSSPKRS